MSDRDVLSIEPDATIGFEFVDPIAGFCREMISQETEVAFTSFDRDQIPLETNGVAARFESADVVDGFDRDLISLEANVTDIPISGKYGDDFLATWFYEESKTNRENHEYQEVSPKQPDIWSDDERINNDDVYPDTPVESEDECGNQRITFGPNPRSKPWELFRGQEFNDGQEFKDALVVYVLKANRDIKLCRWEKTKLEAICQRPCPWEIYCSWDNRVNKWRVKRSHDEDDHSCNKTGNCRMIKIEVIARLWLEVLREDSSIGAPFMQTEMLRMYNIIVSRNQCQKAKIRALASIKSDLEEQFKRLWDYELELRRSNPGTTTEIDTIHKDGKDLFKRFYVCFEALRSAWLRSCRRIIGLDGCFLKWAIKGEILAAVGRDANNGIFPIAWAVVPVENSSNWEWFVKKIVIDLNLGVGDGIVIISDKQKVRNRNLLI